MDEIDDQAGFIYSIWHNLPKSWTDPLTGTDKPLESYRLIFLDMSDENNKETKTEGNSEEA